LGKSYGLANLDFVNEEVICLILECKHNDRSKISQSMGCCCCPSIQINSKGLCEETVIDYKWLKWWTKHRPLITFPSREQINTGWSEG
jgi:hypothetical protein